MEVIPNTGLKKTEVHYFGSYDENKKIFSGNWEIVNDQEHFWDGYLEYITKGTWRMKKENG